MNITLNLRYTGINGAENADEMINTGTVASIRKEEGNLSVKVCNAFLME